MEEKLSPERRMPEVLVEALIQARRAYKKFNGEMAKFVEDCETKNQEVFRRWNENQWLEFVYGLAEGADMNALLDNLQIHPDNWPQVLESLRDQGFPDDFLQELTIEVRECI